MKRSFVLLLGCAAVVVASTAFAHDDEKKTDATTTAKTESMSMKAPAAEEMTYTGEVLDVTCYASHPETGSGPAHSSCAKTCLEKGLPAGILIGDQVFMALMKDHSSPSKALAAYAGQKITVKGVAKEVGGVHFLEIGQIVPPVAAAKK